MSLNLSRFTGALAAGVLALSVQSAHALDITGAGATFPYPDLRQVGRCL